MYICTMSRHVASTSSGSGAGMKLGGGKFGFHGLSSVSMHSMSLHNIVVIRYAASSSFGRE